MDEGLVEGAHAAGAEPPRAYKRCNYLMILLNLKPPSGISWGRESFQWEKRNLSEDDLEESMGTHLAIRKYNSDGEEGPKDISCNFCKKGPWKNMNALRSHLKACPVRSYTREIELGGHLFLIDLNPRRKIDHGLERIAHQLAEGKGTAYHEQIFLGAVMILREIGAIRRFSVLPIPAAKAQASGGSGPRTEPTAPRAASPSAPQV